MKGVSAQGRSRAATYMPNCSSATGIARFSMLFQRQRLLGECGEVAGAERNHFVVEVEGRVVQEAAARPAALPEPDISARPSLEHVGKILAAHGGIDIGEDVAATEELLADSRGELRFALAVDGGGIAAPVIHARGGAEPFGHFARDPPHPLFNEIA